MEKRASLRGAQRASPRFERPPQLDNKQSERWDSAFAEGARQGRIGSKLMNERRKEKPALADEAIRLAGIAQPSLLN